MQRADQADGVRAALLLRLDAHRKLRWLFRHIGYFAGIVLQNDVAHFLRFLDRATHEVVGVVSLSAMDYDETTRARSVFARVDLMPKLVAYARMVADGADPGDMPPLTCSR